MTASPSTYTWSSMTPLKVGTSPGVPGSVFDSTPSTRVGLVPMNARTLKLYVVSLVSPAAVWLLVAALLEAMAVHVPPSCWISQPVTPAMAVQLSSTCPLAALPLEFAGFCGWMPMVKVLLVGSLVPSGSVVSVAV